MNINEIQEKILAGVDTTDVAVMYAQGFGRCLGMMDGMVQRMSPQDKVEFAQRLDEFAQYWTKKVEESAT